MKMSDICKNAAAKGAAPAEFVMGVLFLYGQEVQKSVNASLGWFQKAAKSSYGPSLFTLALLYEKGLGVPKDKDKSLNYLKLAESAGIAEAKNILLENPALSEELSGDLFASVSSYAETALGTFSKMKFKFIAPSSVIGHGAPKTPKATKARSSSASDSAKDSLGPQVFRHTVNNENRDLYISNVRQRANQGDVDYQFILAMLYQEGTLLLENFGNVLTFYKKAAAQGHPPAMRELGKIYKKGEGPVQKNPIEAEKWLKDAAELNDLEAQNILNGVEVKKEKPARKKKRKKRHSLNFHLLKSIFARKFSFPHTIDFLPGKKNAVSPETFKRLYDRANEYSDPKACYRLGNIYYYGQGVRRNKSLALEFYTTAGFLGHRRAQIKSAQIYYRTRYVSNHLNLARSLYLAASSTHVDSMFMLAKTLERGGLEEDSSLTAALGYHINAICRRHKGAILEFMRLFREHPEREDLFNNMVTDFNL
jgi:TPR repeat protein